MEPHLCKTQSLKFKLKSVFVIITTVNISPVTTFTDSKKNFVGWINSKNQLWNLTHCPSNQNIYLKIHLTLFPSCESHFGHAPGV